MLLCFPIILVYLTTFKVKAHVVASYSYASTTNMTIKYLVTRFGVVFK